MKELLTNFCRYFLDPVFAEEMARTTAIVTTILMAMAAVVAIVPSAQKRSKAKNDKEETETDKEFWTRVFGKMILITAFLFFCYGAYCSEHYYRVPDDIFYVGYKEAMKKITAPGRVELVWDEAANEKKKVEKESDERFKVYGINYAPGSLVYHKMNENVVVKLYVTWYEDWTPESKAEKLDFGGDLENPELCAENKIQITANPFLYFSTAKYPDGSSYTERYTYHDVEEHQVVVSLLDAEKQKVVQIKAGKLSDTITFEKLQPGLYYYTVEADGYKPYVPGYAFEITEEGVPDGRDSFYVAMQETDEKPMSEEFRVQVWVGDEHPLPQMKLKAYIERPEQPEEERTRYYKMVTDENGFLFFRSDLTDKTVPVVREFQLQEGCRMMLAYEDAPRDTAAAVEVKNGIGLARLAG